MGLVAHAEREMAHMSGEYDEAIRDAVMALIKVFSEQGHSGFSGQCVRRIFHTLSNFEPLRPLTGEDDEWNEISEGWWQNNRCSRVFKDADGTYDIEGKVFRDSDGSCWINRDSRVPVVFPYIPKTEYVDRAA